MMRGLAYIATAGIRTAYLDGDAPGIGIYRRLGFADDLFENGSDFYWGKRLGQISQKNLQLGFFLLYQVLSLSFLEKTDGFPALFHQRMERLDRLGLG